MTKKKQTVSDDHAHILRLIRNSDRSHILCALKTGYSGMEDFGMLDIFFEKVDADSLQDYLDEIDRVRSSHRHCMICSLKFLAFCQLYSAKHLPERCREYKTEFAIKLVALKKVQPGERDFLNEAKSAIKEARKIRKPHPTNVMHFHMDQEPLS
jgi:hypothetical protein